MAAHVSSKIVNGSHLTYKNQDNPYKIENFEGFIRNIDLIIHELKDNPQRIGINLDIRDLNYTNLRHIKSELHKIAGFAKKTGVVIEFSNFNPIKFLSSNRCCTWFSGHKISPYIDLFQLISAIQSNQKNSDSIVQFNLLY